MIFIFYNALGAYSRGYRGYVPPTRALARTPGSYARSVDWRANMSAIKDQGPCGSCYAESAVAAFEGAWSLQTGHIHNFSVQQAMDCLGSACDGGWMHDVFEWMRWGIDLDSQDRYTASKENCTNRTNSVAFLHNWSYVEPSQEALLHWVSKQPVSIAVNANDCWDAYTGGILNASNCPSSLDPPFLNHGVVVVGYVLGSPRAYWIVRNSWGTQWGEDGYVRIAMNMSHEFGLFGLAKQPTVPTIV